MGVLAGANANARDKRALTPSVILMSLLVMAACATSPTGRKQLQLFPDEQLQQMGSAAFTQMQQQTPVAQESPTTQYVHCVATALTRTVAPDTPWEVKVFQGDDTVNAFALPGGHIGVYTGLLKVAETPDQLATVIGHEIGHVVADHPNARLSAEYAAQAGLSLTGILLEGSSNESRAIMGLLGVGTQVGVLLPFSRSQESESDELGLQYMARAGFDPRASISLWQNMAKASGGDAPPEFLSTHPSHETRMETLESHMQEALKLYEEAKAQGRTPNCQRPQA